MNIAIISIWEISKNAIGGTERFVKDLAESFVKLGNEVDVYMLSGESYRDQNVNYISLDIFGKNVSVNEYLIQKEFGDFKAEEDYIKLANRLESKINKSYDLYQLNSHMLLKSWKDKNRVFTIHHTYAEFRMIWSEEAFQTMVQTMKTEGRKSTTNLVLPSLFYSQQWNEILNFSTKYIPHAIDDSRLHTSKNISEVCSKYSIDKDKIKILLPSRLEPVQKRPMLFLESCSSLSMRWKTKIEILLSGVDEHYRQHIKELREHAEKNSLNVKFIRFDNINEGLLIADIIILPSKTESFGYSALESLSSGIKTILNDIPPFKEIAEGNQSAHFFNGTAEDLNKVLIDTLENKNYFRIKSSSQWTSRYNMKLWAENYIKLFY